VGKLIFVVDSQNEISRLAKECLETAGYTAHPVSPGDVISEARSRQPSLILISLTSECAGLELCRRVHNDPLLTGTALVFMLLSGVGEQCVLALESGADDCIEQPFSARELVARIQAILRRSEPSGLATHSDPADVLIDSWAMKLFVRGTDVSMTTLEFRLIEYLARHRGQVFTRDALLDAVWGDMQFITPRSVDACIRRIRQKIEPDRKKPTLLKTIRGVGYRLDAATVWRSTADAACDCPACTTKPSAARLSAANTGRRRSLA
jgi:DNA-binding response OmpR family regulator